MRDYYSHSKLTEMEAQNPWSAEGVEWLGGHLVLGPYHLMPVFLQETFKQEILAPLLDLGMRILMICTSDAYRED